MEIYWKIVATLMIVSVFIMIVAGALDGVIKDKGAIEKWEYVSLAVVLSTAFVTLFIGLIIELWT